MLAELRPLGLVGIGILPGPIRRPLGGTRRLAKPDDFRGLTIGTSQSRVADTTMRALGATPRRLPATEHWLPGLDGIERQTYGIDGDKLDKKGSHLTTNVNLWPRALVLFAGERAYSALTAEPAPHPPHGRRERRAREAARPSARRGRGRGQHLP